MPSKLTRAEIDQKRDAEKHRLEKLPPLEQDVFQEESGVLLGNRIQHYSNNGNLISPFNQSHLKASGYKLTAGDEWVMGGEIYYLENPNDPPEIRIEPFQVVVIKTAETLVIPRFLIARWNLKVNQVYRGLLWVGGAQVDAGYRGHLFCPLYNLSKKPIIIKPGEEIALMDFVKTTPFDHKNQCQDEWYRYPFPEVYIIEDYKATHLISALYTEVGEKLKKYDEEIAKNERHIAVFSTIVLAVLALVVGALAILFQAGSALEIVGSVWGGLVVSSASFAVILSFHNWYSIKYQSDRTWWHALVGAGIAACIFGTVVLSVHDRVSGLVGNEVSKQINDSDRELHSDIKAIQERMNALEATTVQRGGAEKETKNINIEMNIRSDDEDRMPSEK